MKEAVRLTIVTVCLNDRNRLRRTLRSFLKIGLDFRFEIIVVDGGSLDGTTRLLAGLSRIIKNLRVIIAKPTGIYPAMNRGLSEAVGPWIMFINSGDTLHASANELISTLPTDAHLHSLLVYPYRREGDRAIRGPSRWRGGHRIFRYLLPTSHNAMIFATSKIVNIGYDARYKLAADYALYLQFPRGEMLTIDSIQCITEVDIGGVSCNSPHITYREYIAIQLDYLSGTERIAAISTIFPRAIFALMRYILRSIVRSKF